MQIAITLLLIVSMTQSAAQSAQRPPIKLLVLGNSLVLSWPDPIYDWWGYWGMAASDADHDFAHILRNKLAAFYAASVDLRARHVKPMETRPDKFSLKQYRDEIAWSADVVVVRMGDNVPVDEATREAYYHQMVELIEAVTMPGALLVCTGRWYPEVTVDARQKQICDEHGGRWVVIDDMYQQSAFMATTDALYTDAGVLTHPSDAGHAEIAERIYQAIAEPMYLPVFYRAEAK